LNVCEGLSLAQYGISNVVLSKHRALVGDTLAASCDVHNEPKARLLVFWVRQTPNGKPVEIGVNRGLNYGFKDDNNGRYSVSYFKLNDDIRKLRSQLNITGMFYVYATARYVTVILLGNFSDFYRRTQYFLYQFCPSVTLLLDSIQVYMYLITKVPLENCFAGVDTI